MNKWLDRRPAWQYALIAAISIWLLAFAGETLLFWVMPHRPGLSFEILQVSLSAIGGTIGCVWGRQRRLHRGSSQQLYSEPGPMLPYVGLTSISDTEACTNGAS